MRKRSFLFTALSLMLTPLLFSTVSQAQTQNYDLSGAFVRGEGGLVRLPNIGLNGDSQCRAIAGTYRIFGGQQNTTLPFNFANQGPPPNPITIPLFNGVAPRGCVPGPNVGTPGAPQPIVSPVVANTGGAKASFMLPTGFFSQPEDNVPNRVLVPNIAAIVSLSTDINFFGPPAAGPQRPLQQSGAVVPTAQNPGGTGPPNPASVAQWNNFREGAWTTQTGRPGLAFTWCRGNNLCTNVGQGGGGIVKYSPNTPNGFGGTASVVLSPGNVQGNLPIINGAGGAAGGVAGTTMVQSLLVQPVQAPLAQGGAGAGDLGGKGYRAIQPAQAAGANVYPPGQWSLTPGGFVGPLGAPAFQFPGTINTDNQFPWTTGMVTARNILASVGGQPQTFTWRFSGSDNRTAMGAGNIQMVAGSIRFSTGRGTLTPAINAMELSFMPVPEPGTLGMLAAGGLLLIGATRRRRS